MHKSLILGLVVLLLIAMLWSFTGQEDKVLWFLEATPGILMIAIFALLYNKFRFTELAYCLVALHCLVLFVGARYTYAEVPLFNWLRDSFDWSRNYYDRLGHFVQGFVPAIIAREILIRTSPLKPGKWLFAIVVSMCLAVSAFYEIFEWWAAIFYGQSAEAFLALQGDEWDTQKDMGLALVGAVSSLLLFSNWHDRQLSRLHTKKLLHF